MPTGFEAAITPFPVTDSTGRPLDLAFLGGLNLPRPQLVDLDGDGDLDLVIQEYGDRMIHLERDGTAADGFPRWLLRSRHYGGIKVGEWARFADLDMDGDVDLLAELPNSYVRYWRNDGTRTRGAFVAVPDTLRTAEGQALFADRQNIAQAADLDCNGLTDLFIGKVTGTVARYETTERSAPVPRFRLLTERFEDISIVNPMGSMHGANTMAFADFDADGDLDLFWGDFFERGLLLIENTGTCRAPSLRSQPVQFPVGDPLLTSGYNAPAFGDLDGDGRLDLLVGVLGGAYDPNRTSIENLHHLSRDGSGRWVHRTGTFLPMIDVGSESIPALVDLDQDGDLDLLLANKIDPLDRRTSRIYRFENTGSRTAPSFRMRGALPITGQYHWAPAVGDLDGDGRPDLLLGTFYATLAWYRHTGSGFALADSALVTITRGSNTTPALGDVDGDGDLDLFVGEGSGTLNFYRNEGSPQAPRFVLVSDEFEGIDPGRRSAPALADLDGDGDLDLLVGSEGEGIWLFRNEGTGTAPRWVRDPAFRLDLPPLAAPALGDVNGDGVQDLVVGNVGGGAVWFTGLRRRR